MAKCSLLWPIEVHVYVCESSKCLTSSVSREPVAALCLGQVVAYLHEVLPHRVESVGALGGHGGKRDVQTAADNAGERMVELGLRHGLVDDYRVVVCCRAAKLLLCCNSCFSAIQEVSAVRELHIRNVVLVVSAIHSLS